MMKKIANCILRLIRLLLIIIGALMKPAKIMSISLPPDMQKEVSSVAREERRTVSEVIREAFRQYMALRTVAEIRKQAKKKFGKKMPSLEQINNMVHEGRK